MSQEGVLYSFTTVHVSPPQWHKPMRVGYVDLSNGVRVFSHLKGALEIGATVRLDIGEVGSSSNGEPLANFVFVAEQT
ncbi:MAG: OB-fold domain-containing protein [Hyphomicrobiales bacterium]|nr:OB-fold domain-containing protein [Hyphomicrobiales bacterium]